MYQLFKENTLNRNTKIDSAGFDNLRGYMLKEMRRIVEYYRENNRVVMGDHLVNQLLLHLNVSMSRDIESYVRVCGDETERLARAFNLVHPVVNHPQIRSGTFYHNNVKEFIILHSDEFDYNKAYKHWQKLVPIKVHCHPFTDLTADIPDGKYTNSLYESGYAVISINLPMLALQYRAWQEKVNQLQEYKTQSVGFIYRYPIVNMIYRHMDIALINRVMNAYQGKPVAAHATVHPIAVGNFDLRMDDIVRRRVEYLKSGDYKFDQFFNIFKCLKRDDWFSALKPIDISPVRSVKWVLELQVLRYFEFFVRVRKDRNGNWNKRELTRAERDLKYLEVDTTYFKAAFSELNQEMVNLRHLIESS